MFLLHRVEILVLCWAHHKPLYSVELAVYRNCGVKNCVEWETLTVFDHILINTTFAHGSVNSHLDARRRKESEDLILCCHLWAASRAMQQSGTGEHWLRFNTLYFLCIKRVGSQFSVCLKTAIRFLFLQCNSFAFSKHYTFTSMLGLRCKIHIQCTYPYVTIVFKMDWKPVLYWCRYLNDTKWIMVLVWHIHWSRVSRF